MPRLTERSVASAKPRAKTYRLSDGGGLLLEVRSGGGRAWTFRFMLEGRRRDMGLGAYPAVGLAEARRRAQGAREQVEGGTDPIAAREAATAEAAAAKAEAARKEDHSFKEAAERLVSVQAAGWSSGKTLASWRLTLDRHAYPILAEIPIAEVDRAQVVAALEPVWTTQPATARKLQRRIAAVLDYAAALGWRSTDNPATGRVLRLTRALPKQPPGKKHASLPWQKAPAFLSALGRMEGTASLALRFGILSAVRSAEVRFARWSEIDLENSIWTIPAERMKGGKAHALPPHRVPLTHPMMILLAQAVVAPLGKVIRAEDLPAYQGGLGGDLIFPSITGTTLSDAALGACIRRMNEAAKADGRPLWLDVDGRPAVPHGFRRSFRSWVDDNCPAAGEAAEKALAHEDDNPVRAAYRGSDMLEQRRPLMKDWSAFCCP